MFLSNRFEMDKIRIFNFFYSLFLRIIFLLQYLKKSRFIFSNNGLLKIKGQPIWLHF